MSLARSFLEQNGHALGLDELGAVDDWACVQVTPRYETSAHVVFLLIDPSATPRLVLKAARFPGGGESLEREARSLRAVQAARPGGFDSVPRVIASTEFHGTRVLLETGLPGRPVTDAVVRRRFTACRDALVRWVTELHTVTTRPERAGEPDAFDAHADPALAGLDWWLPEERALIARTRELLEPLRGGTVPRVFEHGDLSAPNLLLDDRGTLQVVDWELASPDGVPACDLFFGLNYLASAAGGRRGPAGRMAGFRRAFFGPDAWATPVARRYLSDLGVDPGLAPALFLLCWVRYTARLLRRLPSAGAGVVPQRRREWLRRNRYFEIWRETVEESGRVLGGRTTTGVPV